MIKNVGVLVVIVCSVLLGVFESLVYQLFSLTSSKPGHSVSP